MMARAFPQAGNHAIRHRHFERAHAPAEPLWQWLRSVALQSHARRRGSSQSAHRANSTTRKGEFRLSFVQNILYNLLMTGTKQSIKTYTASQAREHFAEILDAVEQGEEVAITKYGTVVAAVKPSRGEEKKTHLIPPPGFLKVEGWAVKIAPDFDEIPQGFEDYL